MPRSSTQFLDFARRGAEARFEELQNELKALVRQFPHLGGRGRRQPGARRERSSADNDQAADRGARKRPNWSAAQRRAAAERMRAYWANRKAARKK
jgi:hypothetical protein